jgi:hypothetical protein
VAGSQRQGARARMDRIARSPTACSYSCHRASLSGWPLITAASEVTLGESSTTSAADTLLTRDRIGCSWRRLRPAPQRALPKIVALIYYIHMTPDQTETILKSSRYKATRKTAAGKKSRPRKLIASISKACPARICPVVCFSVQTVESSHNPKPLVEERLYKATASRGTKRLLTR